MVEFLVKPFIDSGADTEFIDSNFAISLGIQTHPPNNPHNILVLDGHQLNKTSSQTQEVQLLTCGNDVENIKFLVIDSQDLPIVLGASWLKKHNLHFDWQNNNILGWSTFCLTHCLKSAVTKPAGEIKDIVPDLSGIPYHYHDLAKVFCKSKATSLPPHKLYDCAIDLLTSWYHST